MTDTCDACRAPVDTKARIRCTKCVLVFHLACVKITATEATIDFRSVWVCPNCRSNEPKGDNSNTPVRQATMKPVKGVVTERQKKIAAAAAAAAGTTTSTTSSAASAATSEPARSVGALSTSSSGAVSSPVQVQPTSEMSLILNEIRLLRQDMNEFKQEIKEVTAQCNRRMDEFDKSLFAAAHRIAELEAAQTDQARLNERITKMEEFFQLHMQSSIRNEVEIVGIPETHNENLFHFIQVLGSKVGENLQECDIDWIDRVGPKSSKNVNYDGQRPRLLVVRFLRRAKRDSFMRAAKARRNLTSGDLHFDGPANKIFVNERLTKLGRQLFQEARRRSKLSGFAHCWTRNGTIFIRKAEGRPAMSIRNQADLDHHLKQFDSTGFGGVSS